MNRITMFGNTVLSTVLLAPKKWSIQLTVLKDGVIYQVEKKLLYRCNWPLIMDVLKEEMRFKLNEKDN